MFKKTITKLILFSLLLFVLPIASALASYRIDTTFVDGIGDPITTALDLRISLWSSYDVRGENTDINGDIITTDSHFGGYQTTLTLVPDENGSFTPGYAQGFYKFYTDKLEGFPDTLSISNAFLQLEYKNINSPNTSYKNYDFVDDPPWQNITRYLLLSNMSYYTYDAGAQTYNNTFTLDGNNNAATEITLQFGETLAESLKWSKTNVRFELSDDLYIDGSLMLNGNLDFAANEMINARVENLASAPTCDGTAKGRLYYNTGDNLIYFCNGTSWGQL